MTRYVDDDRQEFGVEPICRVLQFAPATYYAARSREPSQREIRDEWLKEEIQRIWKEHHRIYGGRGWQKNSVLQCKRLLRRSL